MEPGVGVNAGSALAGLARPEPYQTPSMRAVPSVLMAQVWKSPALTARNLVLASMRLRTCVSDWFGPGRILAPAGDRVVRFNAAGVAPAGADGEESGVGVNTGGACRIGYGYQESPSRRPCCPP